VPAANRPRQQASRKAGPDPGAREGALDLAVAREASLGRARVRGVDPAQAVEGDLDRAPVRKADPALDVAGEASQGRRAR
jgi:hypothetical protein